MQVDEMHCSAEMFFYCLQISFLEVKSAMRENDMEFHRFIAYM